MNCNQIQIDAVTLGGSYGIYHPGASTKTRTSFLKEYKGYCIGVTRFSKTLYGVGGGSYYKDWVVYQGNKDGKYFTANSEVELFEKINKHL